MEKVVEYGIYAYKLAIPCRDEDDEDEDEDDDVEVEEVILRTGRQVTSSFPIDEHPEHNIRITWVCSIKRIDVVDSGGNKKTSVHVIVEKRSCKGAIITGFCKINIIDREGTMLPGVGDYIAVNDPCDYYTTYADFNDLNIPNDPDDRYCVRLEFNIELDEKEALGNQRFTNDLCILFDESLLTDSVLRVSGREFSVHRAVLAARWPRFYEKFSMRSINSVVDVGDVEPEAFEKLLRCIYSNRNPSWLLKEDILLRDRDLVQTLEPSWLKEQSSVDQEEISPSMRPYQ